MEMYTELKGFIVFKPEFRDRVKMCAENFWEQILEKDHSWLKVGRRGFIPFGAPSTTAYSEEDGILSFACELKNYQDEISDFIKMLPEICEDWFLAEKYEEADNHTIHECPVINYD